MQNTGQLLFHPLIRCLRRIGGTLGVMTALALTQTAVQAQIAAADNGLDMQVRQWMSARHGVPADAIQLLPLDPRVRVRPCQSAWNLDQPFAQQTDTVRARCSQPNWQVFVRVTLPAGTPPAPSAAAPARPNAAPAPAPVAESRTVVVATGLLQRGTRIQPEQVEIADREARLLSGVVIERIEDVLHAEVVRDIPAGTVLRGSDIRPAWLVRKGQLVQLTWSPSPGFQITARVESLENGRMGEPVRLKNRDSGRIISGVVTGLGTAAGL